MFAPCLGGSLHFQVPFCGLSAGVCFQMDDPWCVAVRRVSVGCSRVVCMVCQLSIPSSGTYIHLTRLCASFNLFLGQLGWERF